MALALILVMVAIGLAYAVLVILFDDPAVPVVRDLIPGPATGQVTVLQIWSHPDDETFISGTTLAYGDRPRCRAVACYLTAGEAGQPGVPPICRREELGLVRRGEMAVAATLLGLDAHEIADFGDGRLAGRDREQLEEQAVRWIRRYRPNVVVTWDPSGSSGHPDHVRTNEVVTAAFERAADPSAFPRQISAEGLEAHRADRLFESVVPRRLIGMFRRRAFRGNTDALDRRRDPTHAFGVGGRARQRWRAIRAHRTQASGLRPLTSWYGWLVIAAARKEYFALTRDQAADPGPGG